MKSKGYFAVRTYVAGRVGEKIKFWVPGERPSGKPTRRQRSDIRKAAQNEYSAVRAMARLINANFREGDWLLGLDYSEEGLEKVRRKSCNSWTGDPSPTEDGGTGAYPSAPSGHLPLAGEVLQKDEIKAAAGKELVNCIRRVKRELEQQGIELKYVAVTSDMDGETGEAVRVHHHLVINREAREAFVHKWQEKGLGGVSWSPLQRQDDYYDIAAYLIAQVRKLPEGNQYTSSRNLARPLPKDRVVASAAEIRVPKGCRLLVRKEYKPGQSQYVRYVIDQGTEGGRDGVLSLHGMTGSVVKT